jgi:FKBP-type peptidyl-prolyl cis-trans isomerase SlyD
MVIEKNKVVSLIYELRVDSAQGEVVEALDEKNPLTFLYGSGSLLPKFESNIDGLKVGDSFNFELKSEDAYGIASEEAVVDIPKHVFHVNGSFDDNMVQVGKSIPMMDNEGNRLNGIVVNVGEETVRMDFNHPLAGDNLFFNGRITEIREATQEELAHGHIHSSSHSCGSCESDQGSGGCCSGHC